VHIGTEVVSVMAAYFAAITLTRLVILAKHWL